MKWSANEFGWPWSGEGRAAHTPRLPDSSSKNNTRHNLCNEASGARILSTDGVQIPLPRPTDNKRSLVITKRPGNQGHSRCAIRGETKRCENAGRKGRRSVPLINKEKRKCNLRITLREGLRVDSGQIEGGGPLGGEDREQEADKRHRGAYPEAHGEEICARSSIE